MKIFIICLTALMLPFGVCLAEPNQSYPDLFNISDSLLSVREFDKAAAVGRAILDSVNSDKGIDENLLARAYARIGHIFYESGDYDKSESLYTKSIEIRTRLLGRNSLETVESEVGLANIYNMRIMFSRAAPLYQHALEIRTKYLGQKHPLVIETIRLIGQLQKNLGRLEDAKIYFLQALSLAEDQYEADDDIIIRMLGELALIAQHQGNMMESVEYREKVVLLNDKKKGREALSSIQARINLAGSLIDMREFPDALKIIDTVLPISNRALGENHFYSAFCHHLAGIIHMEMGEFSKAESCLVDAENILANHHQNKGNDIAVCQYDLASLYIKQCKFRDAEELLKSSIGLMRKFYWYRENITRLFQPLIMLAHLYLVQGRYSDAEDIFKQAVNIRIERYGSDNSLVAESMLDLSYAYEKQGKLDVAENTVRKSVYIIASTYGLIHGKTADAIQRLANITLAKGNYAESEVLLRQALAINIRLYGDHHINTALPGRALGECLMSQNRFDEALESYNGSLETYFRAFGSEHPQYANTLVAIASTYAAAKSPVKAIGLFKRALSILQQSFSTGHPEVNKIQLQLARAYASLDDISNADKYYELYSASRRRLLDYLFMGANEEQKLRWMNEFPPIDNSLISFALNTQDTGLIALATGMIVENKAAITDAILTEREAAFCSADSSVNSILSNLGQLSTIITNMVYLMHNDRTSPALLDSIKTFVNIRDSLDAELSRKCGAYNDRSVGDDDIIDEIVASLDEGEILVQYVKYRPFDYTKAGDITTTDGDHYAAFSLDSKRNMNIVKIGDCRYVDSLILLAREMIYDSRSLNSDEMFIEDEQEIRKPLKILFEKIISPILSKTNIINTIILSPDGQLNLLPFEVLVNSNRYLIENYRIQYLSSSRDIIRRPPEMEIVPRKSIIFADPDFDSAKPVKSEFLAVSSAFSAAPIPRLAEGDYLGSNCIHQQFTRLHNTRAEADKISETLLQLGEVDEYVDKKASETAIKGLSVRPYIIHIATHGFSCPIDYDRAISIFNHPMLNSGLVMAGANRLIYSVDSNETNIDNGILTAYEVSNLNLAGTKLVTLSTCESGLGLAIDGEGIYGLCRAFRHAGAQNIIMSLWEVPDLETSQLMVLFYKNWSEGQSLPDALRNASLKTLNDLRAKCNHGHPVFWAGFVLSRNFSDN